MTWIGIILLVVLPLFLLISGAGSQRKTIVFYRSFYTREELLKLAENGSPIAKKALEP